MKYTERMKKAAKLLSVLVIIAMSMYSCQYNQKGKPGFQQMNTEDTSISAEIRRELHMVPDVSDENVNIETISGIVTLTGTVDNILARDKARSVAMRIRGVKGVINDITVKTPDIPNDILEEKVMEAIVKDPAVESAEIEVEANNGNVTITGTVDSWQETQIAENTVKAGIHILRNINSRSMRRMEK